MGVYADISAVKRLFKTNRGTRIAFIEDAITRVSVINIRKPWPGDKALDNHDLIFVKSGVSVSTDFRGIEKVMIYFDSPTTYKVFSTDGKDDNTRLMGVGDTVSVYTDPDGKYTIDPSSFSGTIALYDVVIFNLDCQASDDDIEGYIADSEIYIDNYMISKFRRHTGTLQERIFDATDLPDQVAAATAYYAAYLLYTTLFLDQQREVQKTTDSKTIGYSERYRDNALSMIDSYIKISNRKIPDKLIMLSNRSDVGAECVVECQITDCGVDLEIECE